MHKNISPYSKDKTSEIANKVIDLMKSEGSNWFKPFTESKHFAFNRISTKEYSGLNAFILMLSMLENGYKSREWLTYRQAIQLGGTVLKGEKGTQICYYGTAKDNRSDDDKATFRFLKWYTIFNIEQTDIAPLKVKEHKQPDLDEQFKIADHLVAESKANISHLDLSKCFYSPSKDYINMIPAKQFAEKKYYYSVLMHELTHWTGHKDRCDRDLGGMFGSKLYALEELVAELGSAMLSGTLGITKEVDPNHAKYLNSWMQGLKDEPTAILTACAKAQQAVNYLTETISDKKGEM